MKGAKVLLVNETADGVVIYGEVLREFGYIVLTASGAEEAVEIAAVTAPAIIITEVHERTEHGWKTPELLKEDIRTAAIPLVVLTGWVFPEDRARAYASGVDIFLAKPLSPVALATTITAWLRDNAKSSMSGRPPGM